MPSLSRSPKTRTFGGSGSVVFTTRTGNAKEKVDWHHGWSWPEAWISTSRKSGIVGRCFRESDLRVTDTCSSSGSPRFLRLWLHHSPSCLLQPLWLDASRLGNTIILG